MRVARCEAAGTAALAALACSSVCGTAQAFLPPPCRTAASLQHSNAPNHPSQLRAEQPGAGLPDATLAELWRKPRKELLRIGQGGVTTNHVRSLQDLVAAHTIVRVKVNLRGEPSYEDCLKVGQELVEGAEGLRLLGVRTSTKLLLFGDAGFVDGLPKAS